ncbi:MAG: 23S rRNA (adenine2503-C2)-methyltransferase, partial [Planctomycetota bacterium]
SLNATTDEQRSQIMPVNRTYPIRDLKAALMRWPAAHRERITLEYVLRQGENDTRQDAQRLAQFAQGIPHLMSLIPLNEHSFTKSRRPSDEEVQDFADMLYACGVRPHIRWSRGLDIGAACGQLAPRP